MKRLVCIIFLISAFAITFNIKSNFELKNFAFKYSITCNDNINDINYNVISNGNLNHIFTTIDNYEDLQKKYSKKIIAETYVVNKVNLNTILKKLDFKTVNSYMVDDLSIIEGYSSLLKKYITKGVNKLNLQILIGSDVKIGYPYLAEGF